ncbi:MAG: bifunctional 4-hydroxy-2-oxoglutarate aldolase/2-dehydro-3-deoxy-phosphogluconate aldolase [Sporomusaceae bacterium]|nr:bifunctional 4-hydroxy-2-oxoglutarate aldolase/2-dehydro-3-deoxy-phosphogluconate aldolase [Sporomusaceae bacterium]
MVKEMRSADTFQIIKDTGIVVVLRGLTETETVHTVEALYNGGIRAIEVTFNTPGAASIIEKINKEFKDRIIVGAGTVLSTEQAAMAMASGAEFVLAPNVDLDVIRLVKQYGKLMVPGAFTPTEVLACYKAGADMVKVFPVSSVGPNYIKDLKGPYDHMDLMPVGGVTIKNAKAFMEAGSVAVGVGSSLSPKDLITAGKYDEITQIAKAFMAEVAAGRK